LQFLEVLDSDVHTGETLKHFRSVPVMSPWADRGYAHAQGMSEAVKRGAELIVRSPLQMWYCVTRRAALGLCVALKRQHTANIRTLEVVIRPRAASIRCAGWVHAYVSARSQQAAPGTKCRQPIKRRANSGEPLVSGWVWS